MIETVHIDKISDDIVARRWDRDHLVALKEQIIYSKNYTPIKVDKKGDEYKVVFEGISYLTVAALRELGYTRVRIEVQNAK
jgi:hypothetical protein